jgi:hypothetical protein
MVDIIDMVSSIKSVTAIIAAVYSLVCNLLFVRKKQGIIQGNLLNLMLFSVLPLL